MNSEFRSLLKAVSRSFYLSIRLLPRGVAEPVGLAYLLARLSDTLADSAGASAEARIAALRGLDDAIHGRGPVPDFALFAPGVSDPAEQRLLGRAGELLALASVSGDRAEIARVLETIISGQCLDLRRFGCGGGEVKALATAEELEDYTYRVAGCVGEFWTRICCRHLPHYTAESVDRLVPWGVSFGKGLQLVNILRDAPADLALGRCYFPSAELPEGNPGLLKTAPARARAVQDRWLARAREHLDDGLRYIGAVRPWRLRLACFLPWAIGVRTLNRLELERPLEQPVRVKIPRKEVRILIVYGILGALGNGLLRLISWHVKSSKR